MEITVENKSFLIGKKELTCVLINLFTIKMLFTYPRSMVINSGNAAWIQCLYVSLISTIIYFISIKLYEKAGKINIIKLCENVGGRPLKIVVGLIISITLLSNLSLSVRTFPESIKTVLLPITPMELIMIVFLIVASIGAYLGVYSICRIHALFIPIVAIIMLIFGVLLLPYIDIYNIFPILGTGTRNIFIDGLDGISIFGDLLILFILLPYCKNYREVKDCGKNAIIISGISSTLILLLYNLIYSYPASTEFLFPVYNMTRLIKIGDFFQRLEAFFEFIWSISILLYTSLYIFSICFLWKEIFDLKYYTPLIYPVSIIVGGIAFLPSSMVDLLLAGELISQISIPITFLLPIIISILYRIKIKNKS